MADNSQPPVSPEVRRQQQGPALQQYAQGAAAQEAQSKPEDVGKDFVLEGFKQVAQVMEKMAKAISATQPELMPLFLKAVTAMKMVEQGFSKASQGQGAPMAAGSEPGQSPEGPEAMGM